MPDEVDIQVSENDTSCETVLASGNGCRRPSVFYVNGHHACARHLAHTIRRYAVANEGHLWASVQVLPREREAARRGRSDVRL